MAWRGVGFGRVGKGRVGLGVGEGYIWGWARSGRLGSGFGFNLVG